MSPPGRHGDLDGSFRVWRDITIARDLSSPVGCVTVHVGNSSTVC